MLLPSLAGAKSRAQSTSCLSNLKQLQVGWRMYVDDHNDWLPANISRTTQSGQFNVTLDGRVLWEHREYGNWHQEMGQFAKENQARELIKFPYFRYRQ
jgi:hypothetical protein